MSRGFSRWLGLLKIEIDIFARSCYNKSRKGTTNMGVMRMGALQFEREVYSKLQAAEREAELT